MKILCVEQFSELGGGQLTLIDLLPALERRGWQVQVAAPGEGPFSDAVRKLGFHVETLASRSYSNGQKSLRDVAKYLCETPKLTRAIRRIISTQDIRLLYVNAPRLLPAAALAGRMDSVPLVFHSHNRIVQSAAIFTMGQALRHARARVIACCEYAAEPIRPFVKREHISVLYNGVAQLLTRTPDFKKKIRRIGVIGRIEPEKGQLHFVYAARSVLRLFPDCKFVVIGAPLFSGTEYLNRVIGSSIGLPVEFLGWRDDIGAVLSNLDLLAVPSAPVDSAPRVILEAFAARVPVVAFGSGGIPELIRDGETGFLTIANTPAALANRIRSILTMNPFSIRAVVDRAYESWRNRYSLDIYQKRVSDFIAQHYDHPPADIH